MESVEAFIRLSIWVVYRSPSDYPDKWVARVWFIEQGVTKPTPISIVTNSLPAIREAMAAQHLTPLPRYESDDPAIFECWI